MPNFNTCTSILTLQKTLGQNESGEIMDQFFRKVLENLGLKTMEMYPFYHVGKLLITEEEKFMLAEDEATHQLVIAAPDAKLDKFELQSDRLYSYENQGEIFTFQVLSRSEAYVPYSTQMPHIGGVGMPMTFISLLVRERNTPVVESVDLLHELDRFYCKVYGARDIFDAFEKRVRSERYSHEGWTAAVEAVSMLFFARAMDLMSRLMTTHSIDIMPPKASGQSRAAHFEIIRVLRDRETNKRTRAG